MSFSPPSNPLNPFSLHDPLTVSVYKFLNHYTSKLCLPSDSQLEIEVKFGHFIDKTTNSRVQLPILTESILNADGWTRFISDMPIQNHRFFNEFLNHQVSSDRSKTWKYHHSKTIDRIDKNHQRETCDSATGDVLKTIRKDRIADLSIYIPNAPFDARISINVEVTIPNAVTPFPSQKYYSLRKKDRLSYTEPSGLFCIDLTQVNQIEDCSPTSGGSSSSKLLHELELEILRPEELHSIDQVKTMVAWIRELSQLPQA